MLLLWALNECGIHQVARSHPDRYNDLIMQLDAPAWARSAVPFVHWRRGRPSMAPGRAYAGINRTDDETSRLLSLAPALSNDSLSALQAAVEGASAYVANRDHMEPEAGGPQTKGGPDARDPADEAMQQIYAPECPLGSPSPDRNATPTGLAGRRQRSRSRSANREGRNTDTGERRADTSHGSAAVAHGDPAAALQIERGRQAVTSTRRPMWHGRIL